VSIGIIGKYTQLHDAYKSIDEALLAGGLPVEAEVRLHRVDSSLLENEGGERYLEPCDGILIPGGFGSRGLEGKIEAVRYARERGVPFLGICLGMQCAVIEYARNCLNLADASSTELDECTGAPVISLMAEQAEIHDKGGTMRLGAYPCKLKPGTRAAEAYGRDLVSERHRHRYEFNNAYRSEFVRAGLVMSGLYETKDLVEIVELTEHPWFIAVQFHPEFTSRPRRPHPLFAGFVKAALNYRLARREPARAATTTT
jgi:CTP synthase